MILAIETSTAMCSAALLKRDVLVDAREMRIGRGHAEQLVPMIEDLLGKHVPAEILVSVGPGSFTGIRVGIAAAHGLGIGWHVAICGFTSLSAMAAAARVEHADAEAITAVMPAGHGEVFVQGFAAATLEPLGDAQSLLPDAAAARHDRDIIAGPAAPSLIAAGAKGRIFECDPLARHALLLPEALKALDPAPLYIRPPDAKPKAA